MKISIKKSDRVITLAIGFIVLTIDLKTIKDSLETVEHFTKLLELPIDEDDLDSLLIGISFFMKMWDSTEGGDFNAEMFFNKETNSLDVSEMVISKSSFKVGMYKDIMKEAKAADEARAQAFRDKQAIKDKIEATLHKLK